MLHRPVLLLTLLVLCCLMLVPSSAAERPWLSWGGGKLNVTGRVPSPQFQQAVDLINEDELQQALDVAKAITGDDAAYQRGVLMMAVAGHIDVEQLLGLTADEDPDELIAGAKAELESALSAAPDDVTVQRLLNQIEFYQLHYLKLISDDSYYAYQQIIADIAAGNAEAPLSEKALSRGLGGQWQNPFFQGLREVMWMPYSNADVQGRLLAAALEKFQKVPQDNAHYNQAQVLLRLLQERQQHDWVQLNPQKGDLLRRNRQGWGLHPLTPLLPHSYFLGPLV